VWQDNGRPLAMTRRQLDDLLEARRFPADFWAAIQSADDSYQDDQQSWIESGHRPPRCDIADRCQLGATIWRSGAQVSRDLPGRALVSCAV